MTLHVTVDAREVSFRMALSRVPGHCMAALQPLLERFGSGRAVWQASVEELAEHGRFGESLAKTRHRIDVDSLAAEAQRRGCQVLTWDGPGHPAQLLHIPNPPPLLYVRGDVDCLQASGIAMVGTRRASEYGLAAAEMFSAAFAGAGLVVISGMARGIDERSHRVALEQGGKTVAVLGCGADVCYPAESRALKQRIEQNGAVVSEFPPGQEPRPFYFPLRNRVISGLSRAVLVLEAAIKSGAMRTADHAVEQDRPLFAVPNSIFRDNAGGCHRLLAEGTAMLAHRPTDILTHLGWRTTSVAPARGAASPLDEISNRIFAVLGDAGEASLEIDDITRHCDVPVASILSGLTRLELEGLVVRAPGNRYRRKGTTA